jgi:uncharacterized protein YggE
MDRHSWLHGGSHGGRGRTEAAPETAGAGRHRQQGSRRFGGGLSGWLASIAVVAVLTLATFMAGCGDGRETVAPAAQTPAGLGAPNTITVSGKATVTSAPDEAVLTLTVETDAPEPGASLDANSLAAQKVMDRLKAEGVVDAAIETANVSVYPIRTYDPKTGQETLTGYRAQNTVTVTLKDARTVGKVLAASVETGATNISGPVWRLAEDSAAVIEALKKAAANARAKAEALASAQGVKVGEVSIINESGIEQPFTPIYTPMYADKAASGSSVAAPPVNPGSLDVTATVTITYILTR